MFSLLAGSYLALSVGAVRRAIRAAIPSVWPRATIGPVVLLAASISYAAAAGLPAAVRALWYALYLAAPVIALTARWRAAEAAEVDEGRRAPVCELATVALLWLPIEFRLLPPLPVPAPGGYDGVHLLAVVAGIYLFLVARGLSRVGFTWLVRGREWGLALAAFLAFTLVALPIGFATGFIRWNPHPTLANVLLRPVLTLLVTGVPEEFLFRGVIQNLLQRRLRAGAALATASVIFGLAHFPDPRYMLLATLAGVAYGWVFQRTGKITAAAITHALVDAVWVTLLRR
jgi:membrane protease YdiL (CAAX protease family)